MYYGILVFGLITVGAVIYIVLLCFDSRNSNTGRNANIVKKIINPNIPIPLRNNIRNVAKTKKIKNISYKNKYPPRSMTETEKYLYSIKPNLQWWINTHGVKILSRTHEELKGNKLFVYEN